MSIHLCIEREKDVGSHTVERDRLQRVQSAINYRSLFAEYRLFYRALLHYRPIMLQRAPSADFNLCVYIHICIHNLCVYIHICIHNLCVYIHICIRKERCGESHSRA